MPPSGSWGALGEVTVSPACPPGWLGAGGGLPKSTGPSRDLPSHTCSPLASSSPGCLNFSPAEPHFKTGEAVCLTEGFLRPHTLCLSSHVTWKHVCVIRILGGRRRRREVSQYHATAHPAWGEGGAGGDGTGAQGTRTSPF